MRSLLIPTLAALALAYCARNGANHPRGKPPAPAPQAGLSVNESAGRMLFLKNCAHCHGAAAHGDEGPDLHNLDWTDEQIAARIRNGKKGQMTAFAGKLAPETIKNVVAYLRTLK